jgi:hypothetical protein
MNKNTIQIKVDSIETQLKLLKGEIAKLPLTEKGPKEPKRNFRDLYGIWENKVDLSYEEIKSHEYKLLMEL